jgi:hypothetical protein
MYPFQSPYLRDQKGPVQTLSFSTILHDGQLRLSWSARSTLSSEKAISLWLLAISQVKCVLAKS